MHVFARWSIIRRLNSSHITTKTANATLEFQKQFRQFDFSITFRHFLRLRHISSECIWNAISGRHIHTIALTQLENIYCACVKRNCNLKQFFPTITTATWWRKKRVTWNSQGSSKRLIDYTNQRKKYTDFLFHISIMSYRMFSIKKPAMTQSAQQKNASNWNRNLFTYRWRLLANMKTWPIWTYALFWLDPRISLTQSIGHTHYFAFSNVVYIDPSFIKTIWCWKHIHFNKLSFRLARNCAFFSSTEHQTEQRFPRKSRWKAKIFLLVFWERKLIACIDIVCSNLTLTST